METIELRKQDRIAILLLLVIAVLGTALVEYFIYSAARARLLDEIETQLTVGAYGTASVLGEDYHNGLLDTPRSIPIEKEKEDAYRLTAFAQRAKFDYVYTMIKPADDILFVSSSATPEERQNPETFESAAFTKYGEAPAALHRVFSDPKTITADYSDRWGEFHSVFVRMESGDGTPYVVGVDINIEHLKDASKIDAMVALAPLFLIVLLSIPITCILVYSLKRQARFKIQRLYRDNVTGCFNRNKLNADLEETENPILFILNIDRFREVSNTMGPAIGDKLLAEFAHHLSCFRHPDLPLHQTYRLQGDEFAILLDKKISDNTEKAVFRGFYDFVNNFKYLGVFGREIVLSVTIGGAVNQSDCVLLADMALRHAKYTHQDMVIYHDQLGIPEIYRNNLKHMEQLRLALEENRLIPHFQPIFNTQSGDIYCYEALARIVDAEGDVLMQPFDFIPVAERYRLYDRVTRAVISQSLSVMEHNNHRLCINLCIKDIEDPSTANFILSSVKKSGMAHRIAIELLEHESMRNPRALVKFFVKMRQMGCKVGIDDLGKEYSNFDRIMELPLDFIKIDGAVIHHTANDQSTFEILKKVVEACKEKGIRTVAERIDSEEIKQVAIRLGVDQLQGFALGTPQPDFSVAPQ